MRRYRARHDDDLLTSSSYPIDTVIALATCPGSVIVHRDGTVAGCTNDDDEVRCHGRDLRHEGDPAVCVGWWGGCNYCGVH
jgi:hypothetical protein